MNKKIERKTAVSSMGEEADGKCINLQKGIDRKEVKKAIEKLRLQV